jgi:predicted nucleic-acid-binding protein
MIGLDTNVLVRYLSQDDPRQSALAVDFIEGICSEKHPAFINQVVLCETVWVLERCYDVNKEMLVAILEKILKTEQFSIQGMEMVWRALKEFKKSQADFSDCLLAQINLANGCEHTATFDKKASESVGYRLLGKK